MFVALLLFVSMILPSVTFADEIKSDEIDIEKNVELESEDGTEHSIMEESNGDDLIENEELLEEEVEKDSKPLDKEVIDDSIEEQLNNENNIESEKPKEELFDEEIVVDEDVENKDKEEIEVEEQSEDELEAENVLMSVSSTISGSATSRLGHFRSSTARIYKNLEDQSNYFQAGSTYTNTVYYIKRQANHNGNLYYLISLNPSSTVGVIGWVNAKDMSTHAHVGVDRTAKTYYIKGTGSAYAKAWGGSKDLVYKNLSDLAGQQFKINLTERVGNNIWHRGILNGKTAWIHEAYLTQSIGSATSRLGHLRSTDARIYDSYLTSEKYVTAGTTYTHEVYYIKREAKYNGETYYLISRMPSATQGVIGWVKSADISTHAHTGVDRTSKTFYVKGTGIAYDKAWGGNKNIVYDDLSKLKNEEFKVNLTERVGNNIWYRGTLNGKTAWLHSSYVTTITESSTSRLGHVRSSSVKIYKTLGNSSTAFSAGTQYTNAVYYIKRQAIINGQTYYLLSDLPSSVNGVLGWAKASDLSTHAHVGVSKKPETYYIKGTGSAYSRAWGGSKDLVYENLSQFANQPFEIDLTEKVGNNTWYRGVLNGKRAWIHEAFVTVTNTYYTVYDMTLNTALDVQMTRSPQTDRYRNKNGYVHATYVTSEQSAAITSNGVRLRTAPLFADNISVTVNSGTKVVVSEEVTGDLYAGSTKWYKVTYNNSTLYVHSSLVNLNTTTYKTIGAVNVREEADTNSHIYTTLARGASVNVVNLSNGWYEIRLGAWRNAKREDVAEFLNPDNNNQFQHLLLSSNVGVSASELNKVLVGKGVLEGKGEAFIKGGQANLVNEVYLISHALLETGHGKSQLATGVEVGKNSSGNPVLVTASNRASLTDIKKVYNMFGIRAYDSCALSCGAIHAYNQGWDTVDKAIIGGSKFIAEDYIHNQWGQNTIYKMRWNVIYPPKQYATDIGWAAKQTYQIKTMYDQLTNPNIVFDIPVYK